LEAFRLLPFHIKNHLFEPEFGASQRGEWSSLFTDWDKFSEIYKAEVGATNVSAYLMPILMDMSDHILRPTPPSHLPTCSVSVYSVDSLDLPRCLTGGQARSDARRVR
jgi:hypothetical protein